MKGKKGFQQASFHKDLNDDSLSYYEQDKIFANIHDIPVTAHFLLYNGLQYIIKLFLVFKLYQTAEILLR